MISKIIAAHCFTSTKLRYSNYLQQLQHLLCLRGLYGASIPLYSSSNNRSSLCLLLLYFGKMNSGWSKRSGGGATCTGCSATTTGYAAVLGTLNAIFSSSIFAGSFICCPSKIFSFLNSSFVKEISSFGSDSLFTFIM